MTEFGFALGPVTALDCVAVVLAVASLVVSLVAVRHMRATVNAAEAHLNTGHSPCQTVLSLQETVEGQKQQLRDLQEHSPVSPCPPLPRSGLNLNKRSHVLRMHRRGDSAEQIAATLEVPLQEVDLLLKVHRIVLRNL